MSGRRIGWSIAAAATVLMISAAAFASSSFGPDQVVSTDVAKFPSVLVTLSLPGTKDLKVDDVLLTENGTQMEQGGRHGVIVKSLAVSSGEYQSVVLAIDNSKDVSASELKTVLNAAHDFIATVPDTVPFGVVTLASKPQVLQKAVFHDQPDARRALDSIKASNAPATLDQGLDAAVKGAIAPRGQRNIVVFSGASTAAQSLSASTSKSMEKSGARVSAIVFGKAGGDLSSLTDRTAGTAESATTGTLSQVNEALAHRIGDQFLLSYPSHAGPGDQLSIAIQVSGETLHTSATVPSNAPPGVTPSPKTGVFSGTRGYILIIVIIVALLVLTSIPGRVRDRRRRRAGGDGGRGGGGGGRRGGRRTRRRERQRKRQGR
jgi:hypothetical protein